MFLTFREILLPSSGKEWWLASRFYALVSDRRGNTACCDWLFVSSFWLDDVFTSDPPFSFSAGNQMCGSLYDIPLMWMLLLREWILVFPTEVMVVFPAMISRFVSSGISSSYSSSVFFSYLCKCSFWFSKIDSLTVFAVIFIDNVVPLLWGYRIFCI